MRAWVRCPSKFVCLPLEGTGFEPSVPLLRKVLLGSPWLHRSPTTERFVADSPVEGDGFELPVRGRGESSCHARPLETGRCALFADHFIGYPTEGYAFGDRGGRVAPPAADPSQATGRVKRRENQFTAPAY